MPITISRDSSGRLERSPFKRNNGSSNPSRGKPKSLKQVVMALLLTLGKGYYGSSEIIIINRFRFTVGVAQRAENISKLTENSKQTKKKPRTHKTSKHS